MDGSRRSSIPYLELASALSGIKSGSLTRLRPARIGAVNGREEASGGNSFSGHHDLPVLRDTFLFLDASLQQQDLRGPIQTDRRRVRCAELAVAESRHGSRDLRTAHVALRILRRPMDSVRARAARACRQIRRSVDRTNLPAPSTVA